MLMKNIQPGCGQNEIKKIIIDLSPPFISAKSWAIADGHTGHILFGRGESEKREIASLTKIMTAFLALRLASTHHIDLYRTYAKVSETGASISGTTAMLAEGDSLSLIDLFHGMLLPSGNDAAITIAEYFGTVLLNTTMKPPFIKNTSSLRSINVAETAADCVKAENAFVEEMNRMATELKLINTSFLNPHGMHSFCNRSTAIDLAKLSTVAMGDFTLREIVNKKSHIAFGLDSSKKEKKFEWENTNKMLGKGGCNGIKTGITETAGPCLVTSIHTKGFNFIIVLLCSKTMDMRWQEIKKLKEWAIERIKQIRKISKKGKKSSNRVLRAFKHI